MPKLYEYMGIVILFYSNAHTPIHVHAKYQSFESRAELVITKGKLVKILFRTVRGKKSLPSAKLKAFRAIVNKYSEDIVKKWIDFFVYNKPIKPVKITKGV